MKLFSSARKKERGVVKAAITCTNKERKFFAFWNRLSLIVDVANEL